MVYLGQWQARRPHHNALHEPYLKRRKVDRYSQALSHHAANSSVWRVNYDHNFHLTFCEIPMLILQLSTTLFKRPELCSDCAMIILSRLEKCRKAFQYLCSTWIHAILLTCYLYLVAWEILIWNMVLTHLPWGGMVLVTVPNSDMNDHNSDLHRCHHLHRYQPFHYRNLLARRQTLVLRHILAHAWRWVQDRAL